MPELIVTSDKDSKRYTITDGEPLFIGRMADCDIILAASGVSRRHAILMVKNGKCGIKDLESANGTFLNGNRLTGTKRLRDGDSIRIASFSIEYRDAPAEAAPHDGTARRESPAPLHEGAGAEWDEAPIPEPSHSPAAARSESESAKPSDRTPAHKEATKEADRHIEAAGDPVSGKTPPSSAEPEAASAPSSAKRPVSPAQPEDVPPGQPSVHKEATKETDRHVEAADAPRSGKTPPPPAAIAPDEPGKDSGDSRDGERDVVPPAEGRPVIPSHPAAPPPRRQAIPDEEVAEEGEEALPDEFHDAASESGTEPAGDAATAAAAKAAMEAGIVGEFVPDLEEETGGQPGSPPQAAAVSDANPNAMPVRGALRQAIETRLNMYAFMQDLAGERQSLLVQRPKMSDAVKAELARQDREMAKIPTADQAENMIEKRRAKQTDLAERIKKAKEAGETPPPKQSRAMREAEELAINQWTIIIQSLREALPAVYREAYEMMRDEPLARELARANVDHNALFGGAIYFLALDIMLEEAKQERLNIRNAMNEAAAEAGNRKQGKTGEAAPPEAGEDKLAELAEAEKNMAARAAWITQEQASLERTLLQEFWRVYEDTAVRYIPDHAAMPMPVRAFLRHGVIGFQPWWMSEEIRQHILDDCENDVVHRMEISKQITNILYTDEYLTAVADTDCTPALDENLEINERNSPNWKADKALRRLINSRAQIALLRELVDELSKRAETANNEVADLDAKAAKLIPGAKNYKQQRNEILQQRQLLKVEASKLSKLVEKIQGETMASLDEAMRETNERFESGELPRPTQEFLIRRECGAVHKIARLLANLKEKFMPFVVRDSYAVDTDALNSRKAIAAEFRGIENRDPGLLLKNLIPSKKKANRVDLRISPVVAILPAAGLLAYSWNPRSGQEDGRLAVPTCFIRQRLRERQLAYLVSDFRWDTSKADAGMDVMTSDTIVAAFMTVRWDWRKRSKEGREKGLVYTEQNDRTNWRRVYEAYLQTAFDGGKKLYNRNYDFYERIIGKYFDLPEGVVLLKK